MTTTLIYPPAFPQVGSHYSLFCKRSNNVCLLLLPSPQTCFYILNECTNVIGLLLLCSGDVESNPGPMTKDQETQFNNMMELLQKLDDGQSTLLTEVKSLQHEQHALKSSVSQLGTRVASIETDVACAEIYLVFYGIPDSGNESWAESEQKIIELCSDKLSISINPDAVERAHRLGRSHNGRTRPIIHSKSFYTLKERILSSSFKLKGTNLSVSEDFASSIRNARKHMLTFGRAQASPFRPRFDNLLIGNKCFVYDETLRCVRETFEARRTSTTSTATLLPSAAPQVLAFSQVSSKQKSGPNSRGERKREGEENKETQGSGSEGGPRKLRRLTEFRKSKPILMGDDLSRRVCP
ncbi:uncharacterized protein LOC135387694 [Ornithodoros turicata]|uniref:uncharacterized protein LOC135387694 n=1 Tax=Ornithodoros turicata TaxID=34597 RepID=UPI0031394ADC